MALGVRCTLLRPGGIRPLLEGAGLEDVGLRTLSLSHWLSGPDELWAGTVAGTVRTAAAIRGQTEAMQRAIRAAFDELAAPYVTAKGFDVPVSIHVAAGRGGPRDS